MQRLPGKLLDFRGEARPARSFTVELIMYNRLDRAHRAIAVISGVITLVSCAVLLVWDARPSLFPARAHDVLGAFPLAMIAVAYLIYQTAHRPPVREFLKAIMLAVAFLFWAANQLWPDLRQATLFNDIAIALFVLDVFLVIIGWPPSSPDESFAETYSETDR
jgi:hypothetical protein